MYTQPSQWGKFDYETYAQEHNQTNSKFTDADDFGFEERD